MHLTIDQVIALAPDASAAAAGRKLGGARSWQNLGRSDAALWGECQGSALYQVRIDLADLTVACSCPSRKFPCKHGIGLLLLAAASPDALPTQSPPNWVTAWLAKRAARAEKRADPPAKTAPTVSTPVKESTRADQRLARVTAGLDTLDLWLSDLIRNGLASVETQPFTFWEQQAARMVDAQAPGIAARLRRMAGIPNASPDWPERLLAELGRLALLMRAFRRLDALAPPLREDVRAAVGWTLKQEEVIERGDTVTDTWHVLGQHVTTEGRLRTQRAWLQGARSGRHALILQFAVGAGQFETTLVPGTTLGAALAFWPSAYPLRALIHERWSVDVLLALSGPDTLPIFLDGVAAAMACQPWLERFPAALRQVTPIPADTGTWHIRDREGNAVPLVKGEHWLLLALSGGAPVDLFGEWDGETLLPLGVRTDGAYQMLREAN
jgi:hypothetical protein